jgi:hypothetical protein
MAKCKLQSNITKECCHYRLAGVKSLYLINFDAENKFERDANGAITKIELADKNLKAYKIDFADGTASWTDELAMGGNGGKYRTHTANFTIGEYTYNIINQSNALNLGRFTAIVSDKSGRSVCLGRSNGLSATSFNYASGAADADANGWTVVLSGAETEVGQLLASESVIASIAETTAETECPVKN